MSDAPKKDEEPSRKERWVYIGQRLGTDTKLSHYWYTLQDHVVDFEKSHAFDKRIEQHTVPTRPRPGAIFEVHTVKEGTSVIITGDKAPLYVEMLDDEARVLEWRVAEEADLRRHGANRRFRQEMTEDLLGKALEPILAAMRRTNAQGRQAIKLIVLERLEKP